MKKADPNPKANRHILMITYAVAALFAGLVLYFAFFLQIKSENVINNSYNARLDSFSDRVVRGEILSSDGRVLAQTNVDENGGETRYYPYDSMFSHVVGYSTKGKTGLEALGNFYLLTSHVNLAEQVINELSSVKNLGDNVITTLDVDLQKAAYDALGSRKGASCSTFKIVTALEYIRENPENFRDYRFDCSGFFHYEDYTIKCYHETAHGSQDFVRAFANSCNGAFANLALTLDLGRLKTTADQLLFDTPLPIAIPYSQSAYALTPDGDTWQILQTSIGQGQTQMTPIHGGMIAAAIANGGTLMKPYLIDHVENVGGDVIKKFMPQSYGNLMTAEESASLTELMRAVVTEGTGSAVRTDAYTVAGKTGSAEFDKDKETHAWFIGFAPAEHPKLVVSVIVEEGGSGGKTAAPIARSLFDTYFSR